MNERMNYSASSPEAYDALLGLQRYLKSSSLPQQLHELIKIRASIINGCGYCIAMHTKAARALGESEERLYALAAWWEFPQFDDQERAVLKLTDAMTRIADGGVPDEVWSEVSEHFDEPEVADIILAIITINAFNRLAISTRMVPGVSRPVLPRISANGVAGHA